MTIEEIDKEILRLTKLREEKKRESIINNSKKYIGKYYIDPVTNGYISIGKIIGVCEEDGNVICNEIALYPESIHMESSVINPLEQINVTTKEEIFKKLDEYLNGIKLFIN